MQLEATRRYPTLLYKADAGEQLRYLCARSNILRSVLLWTPTIFNFQFSRQGVNDWEKGTNVIWKHKMDLPSDAFFGKCRGFKIQRNLIPKNLSVEVLGYYNRDNIKIDTILVAFVSPTWLGQPLEFETANLGWTTTNINTYGDGGVHVLKSLKLQNQG
jgi:hypothetical protein